MSDDATEDVALTFGEDDLDPKRRRVRLVITIAYSIGGVATTTFGYVLSYVFYRNEVGFNVTVNY